MSIRKLHNGTVKNGKFIPDDRADFVHDFYRHEGKRITVTIERYKKKRSDNQNRYMWGVVYKLISVHTGYTPEEVNEAMKWKFLRIHKDNLPDTVKSSKFTNSAEFEEYMENIRRWASVYLGLYIPLPNECEY